MKSNALIVLCALLGGLFTTAGNANRMTEVYIPIGQSPGVSGVLTTIGEITSRSGNQLEVRSNRGTESCRVNSDTMIWVDNSASGNSNADGSINDLQRGRKVEIRFVDPLARSTAVWIKVQP